MKKVNLSENVTKVRKSAEDYLGKESCRQKEALMQRA